MMENSENFDEIWNKFEEAQHSLSFLSDSIGDHGDEELNTVQLDGFRVIFKELNWKFLEIWCELRDHLDAFRQAFNKSVQEKAEEERGELIESFFKSRK